MMNLNDFQKRKLKKFYIAIYVITKETKIRTETSIADKMIYIIVGVDIKGNRQILGVYFDNPNDNRFWLEKLEDIKARGVERILFLVTPKNKNIEKGIKILYNNVELVNSPDEIYKSVTQFYAEKPSRENEETYKIELEMFKERYIESKIINILLSKKEKEIEQFYKYSYTLRKLLYPYYLIREMQRSLNKLKNREKLCTNINEVIEAILPYINSFEKGRSYSKNEWLEIISDIYEENKEIMEEYLNG